MENAFQDILYFLAGLTVALLAVGIFGIIAWRLFRLLPMTSLWRLQRTVFAVLLVVAFVTTILAQKSGRSTGTTGNQPGTAPQTGTTGVPPVENELYNTLHFSAIDVHTNGTATLLIAWPPSLFAADATLDLFAATSLVNSTWVWQCEHQVAAGETNWLVAVALPQTSPGTNAPSAFFYVSNRETCADTMDDMDSDGLPNAYELAHGTNPYVQDYASAFKLTVGPGGDFTDIQSALAASTNYSIIELDSATRHEITDSLGVQLPLHPVMVTASTPYAVVRATGMSAFMLASGSSSRTLFQNLYLLLDSKGSFQTGFWCGGNLPWDGIPAAATFENVYVRMPNPDVRYRAWNFHRSCADTASIRGCTVNAAEATWAVGIYSCGSSALVVDRCSLVNFPPMQVSPSGSSTGEGVGVVLVSQDSGDGGSAVSISWTVFDESFTNAIPLYRSDPTRPYALAVTNCIVPSALTNWFPDSFADLTVTNADLAWSGIPRLESPSVTLGVGSLMPIANNPSVDTDNDSICDYEEVYGRGLDPFNADSDNDGVPDGVEILEDHTDPANPHSFKQSLTVSVTNSASLATAVYTAWGYSPTGWETNELATFSQGFGETAYTNASSQGATHVKAFCDLNGNGTFDTGYDILLSSHIPTGSTAHVTFTFGDVDGDGVSDSLEREDGTNPYDKKNFRIVATVNFLPCGAAEWLTNYVAVGHAYVGWEANGQQSFNGTNLLYSVDETVTNGTLYAKVFRDLNTNGVYDVGDGRIYVRELRAADRGNTVTVSFGDGNSNEIPDWWEAQTGLDAEGVARRAYDDPDGDGLINLHEYWCGTHPLVPDGSNTFLSVASRSIDDRIWGIDPATAIPRFVNYFVNGTNGIFQQNVNFWARDLDLSCVSVWNDSANPGGRTATLITRRHIVMAKHWPASTYVFCDTNGVILRRTVLQWSNISDDLRLGRLDEALPESFSPAYVPSTNIVRYLASGKYLPTLCFNQEKGASVLELTTIDGETTDKDGWHYNHYGSTSNTNLVSVQRCNVRGATVDGNSGCPVFVVADDKLILLFSNHLGFRDAETWRLHWGPGIPFRLEAIQNRINEWEGNDAYLYQIESFCFSSFSEVLNK